MQNKELSTSNSKLSILNSHLISTNEKKILDTIHIYKKKELNFAK
jgi:hypothetical protein